MYINQNGEKYGFCPGKATWDTEATEIYSLLLISAETGNLIYAGGIADQPAWFIDLLSWFLPRYDNMKFVAKADMILGGDSKKSASKTPGPGRIRSGKRR
jgi:hypothetical protein